MAEPLKNFYGPDIPRRIAGMISPVFPTFDSRAFVRMSLDGYEALELKQRAAKIAAALAKFLPADFEIAIDILLASLGPRAEKTEGSGMEPFLYLPHTIYVAEHGLDHFEASMRAQHELTQRFTAEFSIRSFIERYPDETLARLKVWTRDPSQHVRRLVSEGTRPLLPWASRLRQFQKDPTPVLALLELLKDDESLYVRRSVANNLNDIGKDHPELLAEVARRWLLNASEERRWLVNHALRSAVKRGEPGALAALGYGQSARVTIGGERITPKRPVMGESVNVSFDVTNATSRTQQVLADLRIHFVKANGKASPKVFKLKTVELPPRGTVRLAKTISLVEMTTRKHYPGTHVVEVLLNGRAQPLGTFELRRR